MARRNQALKLAFLPLAVAGGVLAGKLIGGNEWRVPPPTARGPDSPEAAEGMNPLRVTGKDLRRVDLRGETLAGANYAGVDLRGARLDGADCARTDFSRARMEGATLDDARLVGANLAGTTLTGASLKRADLRGARLDRARLDRADFSGARYDAATRWPAGVDPRARGATGDRRRGRIGRGTRLRVSGPIASMEGEAIRPRGVPPGDH